MLWDLESRSLQNQGAHWNMHWNLAGSDQIRPDPGHFGQIQPASDHGRISASFSRNLVHQHPVMVARCRRIPAPAIFRWPDVAGFRRRLDSDDRLLSDSDNQISNVRTRTKNLISENNLWLLKP
jgi:hypothetical protein